MTSNQKNRRRSLHQALFLVIVGLLGYFLFWRFAGELRDVPVISVTFDTPSGAKSPSFKLEVVSTPGERQKGLMYRKEGELGKLEGMLFVFPEEKIQNFWMKDTYIPLDMLFVDKSFKVVGVLQNVPVLNETPRKIEAPSLYVVELNAGTTAKYKIEPGSILKTKSLIPHGS